MTRFIAIISFFTLTNVAAAVVPEDVVLSRAENTVDSLYKNLASISNLNTDPIEISRIKAAFENYFRSEDQNCPNEFKNIWHENSQANSYATDIRPRRYINLFYDFFHDKAYRNCSFSYEYISSCIVKEPEVSKDIKTLKLAQVVVRKSYFRNGRPFSSFNDTLVVGLEEMKIRVWANNTSMHPIGYFGNEVHDIERLRTSAALAYNNKQYDKAYQIYQKIVKEFPNEASIYYYWMIDLVKEKKVKSQMSKEERRKLLMELVDNCCCSDSEDKGIMSLLLYELYGGHVSGIPLKVQKWLYYYYETKYTKYDKYGLLLEDDNYYKYDFEYLIGDSANSTPFVCNLMPIFKGGGKRSLVKKYGYMNKEGKMITPFRYTWAEPFSKQYEVARVGIDYVQFPFLGRKIIYGIINTKGEILTKKNYLSIRPFFNGYAVFEELHARTGFINPQGKEVINGSYKYLTDYKCGWFGYHDYEKAGFMNFDGGKINDESYYNVWAFDEDCNLACVSKKIGDKEYLGCIDSSGREVIPLLYYSIRLNGKEGTITLQENIKSEKRTMAIRDYKK